jgi:NPCBM/NEW2 domain
MSPFLTALVIAAVAPSADEVISLSGERQQGEVISFDAKELALRTRERLVRLPAADVQELKMRALAGDDAGFRYTEVALADGSVLRCQPGDGVTVDGTKIALTLLNGLKLQLGRDDLFYVLKNAHDPSVRQDWDACLKACLKERRDVLPVIEDGVMHPVIGTYDQGKGTVWNFKSSRDWVGNLKQDRKMRGAPVIQGWIFYNQLAADAPAELCRLHDSSRNLVVASKVETRDGGPFVVHTVSGARLVYPRDQLVRLDFSKGRLEFLSDLEPRVRVQPAPDRFDRYQWFAEADRRNRNLDGKPLQLGGTRFSKGLSLPAPTAIEYTLAARYKQFSTVVGVDDTVGGGQGALILTIEGDGRLLFSGEIKRNDPPVQIRSRIDGVGQLTIKVRPKGALAYGLRVDLADPKISK